MTAVRSVRSTAYGAKLFAYVLAVAAVGGGLLGLGYSLAWPALADVAVGGASVEAPATLAAGSVLGLLGICVLGAGLLGTLHKLVADGVATGIESAEVTAGGAGAPAGDSEDVESADRTEAQRDSADQPAAESQPSPGDNSSPGAEPETGPADNSSPGAEPETGPGEKPPDATVSADGTDETATAAQPPAKREAGAAESGTATAAPDPNGPASPEADGTAVSGATDGKQESTEPFVRAGASAGGEPKPATGAAEAADAPEESGAVSPDPEGTPEPDQETDDVSGLEEVDDSPDEWMSPDGLETERVDVDTSDTVPVDGTGEPDPGAIGVEDVGATDRPADPSPDPPEPSPEEIAFGSSAEGADQEPGREPGADSGSEDRTVTERADWFEEDTDGESDSEPTAAESSDGADGVEPAGSTAPSDPLADPTESE